MCVIIKMMKNLNWVMIPVIILNGQSEIWEFETESAANEMKNIFSKNSDSGYEYIIKKI